MKYCYQCGRITAGEPVFCQSCGRSFDVKLCSRLHVNPRYAEVCSHCGSRELSTPQPKVPFSWKVLGFVLRITTGLLEEPHGSERSRCSRTPPYCPLGGLGHASRLG